MIGRYLNGFCSYISINSRIHLYRFHLNTFCWLLLELHIYVFSLYNRLNISLIYYFFSRSCYCLCSCSFLQNWLSYYRFFVFIYRFSFLKFNKFFIVNNLFLNYRLSIYFFCWCLNGFSNNFFFISCRSSLNGHINNFWFTSIYLKLYIFCDNSGLNIFFSNSGFSRYLNRHINYLSLVINNRFFVFCFCVNRSLNYCLSYNWCLNYSLLNDRLLNNSLSYYRLGNDLLCNHWF